jgi:hypothetical protein
LKTTELVYHVSSVRRRLLLAGGIYPQQPGGSNLNFKMDKSTGYYSWALAMLRRNTSGDSASLPDQAQGTDAAELVEDRKSRACS